MDNATLAANPMEFLSNEYCAQKLRLLPPKYLFGESQHVARKGQNGGRGN
jgi:hypothetical protein